MIVAGITSTSAPAVAALAPSPHAMTMSTAIPGMAMRSSVDHGDGSVTVRWSAPTGEAVTVTGTPGAVVSATRRTTPTGGQELFVDVRTPDIDKADTEAVAKALNAYQTGMRSVQRDAANTGIPASEVSGIVPLTVIFDSWCVDVTLDSRHWEHFCDVREKVQDNGGGDWYMGDEMTGSTTRTGGQYLYSSYGGVAYTANNTMVKWQPSADVVPSSGCATNTQKLSYNGVELSSETTVCPSVIHPYTNRLGGAGLEEFWHGCDDGVIGLNPVDVIHSPPSASVGATLKGYIHTEPSC